MRIMLNKTALKARLCTQIVVVVLLLLGWHSTGYAGESVSPDVIELYTSHGCSSCPRADKLLAELIDSNDDLVALEFHVDYWNQLVHGNDGSWVDPFSSAAYTDRQQEYNLTALSGRRGVYTPQMIINGEYAAVGSDRKTIKSKLGHRQAPVSVLTARTADGGLRVTIDNPEKLASHIWLVVFDVVKKTEITAGENRHLTLENHHIVKSFLPLQKMDSHTVALNTVLNLAPGEGCAVLVQSQPLQPVLGAALCP